MTGLGARARAAGIASVFALAATFPLMTAPLARIVGHPDVDATNHAWGPWWWWITLGRGEVPFETRLLGAPEGGTLWFIDPIGALIGAPFVGVLGVAGAYNLAIVVSVAVAALGARRLAMALGASGAAGWIAGAAAACGPYLLSEVHNGVSEAVGVGWGTLALAEGVTAIRGGGRAAWLRSGMWLGVATAGTWYYGFATGITLLGWALLAGRAGLWARLRGLALAGVPAVAIAVGPLIALLASVRSARSLVQRGAVGADVREMLLAHNAVDPLAYVAPLGFQSVDLATGGEAFLHSSYVGLFALALAAIALHARSDLRRVAVALVPCFVLSLGAYLWWNGDWARPFGARVALPFAWLLELLPAGGSTHSQRLAWPVVVTISAFAAVGAERLAPDRRVLGALGLLVVADLLAASPWPLARLEALDMRAHARIRELNRAAAREGYTVADGVLDLPAEVGATMATSRYLVYQAASQAGIPYRPDARGGTAGVYGMPWFGVLYQPSAGRPAQAEELLRTLMTTAEVDLRAAEEDAHVRWIVLHRELERGRGDVAVIERQLRAWFGEPEELGPHLTWDVRARTSDNGKVLRSAPAPEE